MIILKFSKRIRKVLQEDSRLSGQIGLGLIVGLTLFFSDDVIIEEKVDVAESYTEGED